MVTSAPALAGSPPSLSAARSRSWWGDRGVSTKILSAVGAASVVAVGIGVLGLTSLSSSASSTEALYRQHLLSVGYAGDLASTLYSTRIDTRDALLNPDPAGAQQTLDGLDARVTAFDATATTYRGTHPSADSLAALQDAESSSRPTCSW